MTQLLVTLRFFATGNFLTTAGDLGGISVVATGQIVKKVSYALASLSDKYVLLNRFFMSILYHNFNQIDLSYITLFVDNILFIHV